MSVDLRKVGLRAPTDGRWLLRLLDARVPGGKMLGLECGSRAMRNGLADLVRKAPKTQKTAANFCVIGPQHGCLGVPSGHVTL